MTHVSFSGYPKGWFVVAFSSELPIGGVKPIRYFGRDLVLFRAEDGGVHVLDAYCPHLGAHLGYGGEVVGSTIQCPFHAWRFDACGACIDIPYVKNGKIPPGAKVGSWPTRDLNGVIMVWHDRTGAPPEFDIPPIAEFGSERWLPWSTKLYAEVKTHPKEIVDNLADKAHFPAVHKTEIDDFGFEVNGHLATQMVKGRAFFEGGVDQFESRTTYHGPGYLLMRMSGLLENYMLVAHTPISENRLDLRLAVMLKIVGDRKRTEGYVGMYLKNLQTGFEDDFKIWETKVYRDRPVLCDGDGPIGHLRKWYRQFYASSPDAAGVDAQSAE